jgi:hypothetical protein
LCLQGLCVRRSPSLAVLSGPELIFCERSSESIYADDRYFSFPQRCSVQPHKAQDAQKDRCFANRVPVAVVTILLATLACFAFLMAGSLVLPKPEAKGVNGMARKARPYAGMDTRTEPAGCDTSPAKPEEVPIAKKPAARTIRTLPNKPLDSAMRTFTFRLLPRTSEHPRPAWRAWHPEMPLVTPSS